MKKFLAFLLVAIMTVSLVACGGSSTSAGKTLIMGCSADFPPFEFYDLVSADGKISGLDAMIASEIAKDYGATLEIKDVNFDALLGAMKAGQIDMILSGMNATVERKKEVDFSTEYFSGTQVVLVQKAELGNLKTAESLSGKQVGVQLGTIQEEFAEDQLVPHGATLLGIAHVPDIVMQLKIGTISAIVLDEPIAQAFARNNDDLAISEIPIEGDGSGIAVAVPKGEKKLLDSINATLARLEKDGKIEEFLLESVELAAQQEAASK